MCWKLKCHREKYDGFKNKFKPPTLNKIFFEYLTENKIAMNDPTKDEIKLFEELKKKDFETNIPTWILP